MANYSFSKSGTSRFSPPKPIDNYPKDAIKKMAVLFTDIVDSSNFFKTQGDIAGRKMLKLHQDMASPVISEFGGVLVKILGDSVMAYFLDPSEALKSAIKIQQKFETHNKGKEARDQIHIRICIHFGDGIVEEKDNARFDRSHFSSFGDFNIVYETVYYINTNDYNIYMDVQQYINLSIKEEFEKRNIQFAYPTQLLYIHKKN